MACGLLLALALLAPPPAPEGRDLDDLMRRSIAGAQALQGPLDGAWTLRDAAGRALFAFQLVDPASGGGVQGAWRDLRGPMGGAAAGFIDSVRRQGRRLVLNIPASDGGPSAAIHLTRTEGGPWAGRMVRGGIASDVILRRNPRGP